MTSCIRAVSVQNCSSPKVSWRKMRWPSAGAAAVAAAAESGVAAASCFEVSDGLQAITARMGRAAGSARNTVRIGSLRDRGALSGRVIRARTRPGTTKCIDAGRGETSSVPSAWITNPIGSATAFQSTFTSGASPFPLIPPRGRLISRVIVG